MVQCSLCKLEACRKVKFIRTRHFYCAFHSGYIRAIIDLARDGSDVWEITAD